MNTDLELDCAGMICPRPVIELAKVIDSVAIGGTVAVLADDVAAATDIPAWCRLRGHDFVTAQPLTELLTRYVVRRVDAP